jgi:hypothetical protein
VDAGVVGRDAGLVGFDVLGEDGVLCTSREEEVGRGEDSVGRRRKREEAAGNKKATNRQYNTRTGGSEEKRTLELVDKLLLVAKVEGRVERGRKCQFSLPERCRLLYSSSDCL